MELRVFRPSRCAHALKDREGALDHAEGMKGKHSSLQGAFMHSRRAHFFVMKECTQEENFSFLGAIF